MAFTYGAYTACLQDRPLEEVLDILKANGLTGAEVNAGGFIPSPHAHVDLLLGNAAARTAQKKDLYAGFWFYGAMAGYFLLLTTLSIAILWWLRRRYSVGFEVQGQ